MEMHPLLGRTDMKTAYFGLQIKIGLMKMVLTLFCFGSQ